MTDFTMTPEELVEASVAGIVARAKELGSPISDEDLAELKGFMAGASVDLPKSQAEYEEKMAEMKAMPLEALQQMLGMFKRMAGMGAATTSNNNNNDIIKDEDDDEDVLELDRDGDDFLSFEATLNGDDAPFVPPTEENGSMDFMSEEV